jgi:energy-coupling factor transporter ATP-binding protein EcfA2
MANHHNPFATCYTAPGCVPFLVDQEALSAEVFFAQLHRHWVVHGRVGAIVGPHGCGKSTLLAALEQAWPNDHAYRVTKIALHDGQRTLPTGFWQHDFQKPDLVIVDGYEQLGWRARWRLNRLRGRTQCGLLVTTHAASKLPTLQRVEPSYETLLAVVRRLLESLGDSLRTESFIARHVQLAWQQSEANARETLFRLYDCWETEMCVAS